MNTSLRDAIEAPAASGALSAMLAPLNQPQQPQQPQPVPSHEQTVAALRHFQALITEGRQLLKNPDLGKADLKSDIIDIASKLVGNRILSAADAVTQLATVPEKPFEQKQWVENLYAQAVTAQAAVLDHHRAASIGSGDYEIESLVHKSDPEKHRDTMKGLMESQYARPKN